jgi:hypothetical protein
MYGVCMALPMYVDNLVKLRPLSLYIVHVSSFYELGVSFCFAKEVHVLEIPSNGDLIYHYFHLIYFSVNKPSQKTHRYP